jgi:putative PEP-CTERM system histidine kinase
MSTALILAYAAAACAGIVALIAAVRGWRSISVWFFVAGMALLAAESAFLGLAIDAWKVDQAGRWHLWSLTVTSFLPGVWLLFSLSFGRGNYREFFRQWRFALIGAVVVPVLLVMLSPRQLLLIPVDHRGGGQLERLGAGLSLDIGQADLVWVFRMRPAGMALCLVSLVSAVLVLMNLERTFRTAVGTMRWRIKFMILALVVVFCVRAYAASQLLLWRNIEPSLVEVNCGALALGCLLMLRSLFRDVSEVAVFPSKAIFGNSLTVLAAGIYFVIVGIVVKLAAWIEGFKAKVFLFLLMLVAVMVVALSDRVRLHTRRFISRYFQRPFYDYRLVWRTLTEGIASRLKEPDLSQAAVTLISDIFQVLSVTIWLVDEKKENLVFAASTSLSAASGAGLQPQKEETQAIIWALQNHRDPVDFETSDGDWAMALRRSNPSGFRTGGGRVCVPLVAGGQLLGVIVLGDRVGGLFFSMQDFDLLRCVGDQVVAGLLNAQLSQKLLQAKELEAFQTMSAFFVHDLKNTASTLNLMLQNLPIHFDNPAFRQDALRGMAATCEHINHLISRLSLFRHDSQLKLVASDLNDVVADVLSTWTALSGMSLVKNFRPCPAVLLDAVQFRKVVTNLLINATEAVSPPNGQIRVETSHVNGWAVLAVTDNGCGMTPEFLSHALFRPFQTTKKKGLGIGMFQSKMIIEAHGGRIEVESEAQKGTTFRVLLPIEKQAK